MKTGGCWLVWRPPLNFFFENFCYYFWIFFRIFILPSVYLCRVFFRHSAKALPSARQKTLGKVCLPSKICRVSFAECYTRQTLCRVFFRLCRVPLALGKPPDSRSASFNRRGSGSAAALLPVGRGSTSSAAIFPVGCGSNSSSAVFPFRRFNIAAATSASLMAASCAAVCWDPASSAYSMAPFLPSSPSFGQRASCKM